GETALLRCAGTGNVDAVKSLLAHGADINAPERAGQTALMWAIEEHHADVARLLIEHGADVNALSHAGFTPLLFAARQGDVESARLLLEKGANVNVTANMGSDGDAAKGLLWFNHPEPHAGALWLAVTSGREEFSKFIVEKGVNLDAVDSRGM